MHEDGTGSAGRTDGTDDHWYVDPTGRAPLRMWRAGSWSRWLSDGQTVWADPRPVRRALGPLDLAALRFVDEVFLPELRAGVTLDDAQERGVREALGRLTAEATGTLLAPGTATGVAPAPAPVAAPASAAPFVSPSSSPAAGRPTGPASAPAARPASRPVSQASTTPEAWGPHPAAVPVAPSPRALRWRRLRETVGSSLALHGLAYLGVLLMFVGVFGLVAFAFGDVRPGLRPLAELVCAAVPFVAAWWLIGHGAVVVGRALEVVGGLLAPILLITSVLDGFPVPPDPHGPALAVVLTGLCLLCAGAGLLWSRRHPLSGIRFSVAPTLWLAAAMLTIGVGRPWPAGQDVAVPSAAQTAAMALALVLTTAAARRWSSAPWAGPAAAVAGPGTVVVGVLVALTWIAGGWPTVPVALAGSLLVLQIELLRPRLPAGAADLLTPMTWGVVGLALLPGLPAAVVGFVLVLGFMALTELIARRGAPARAVAVPAIGVGVGLLLTVGGAWWGVVAPAAVAVWVVVRRARPVVARGPVTGTGTGTGRGTGAAARAGIDGLLDGAAVVAPLWVVLALEPVVGPGVALVVATVLVVLATVPARVPSAATAGATAAATANSPANVPVLVGWLLRDAGDSYWRRWWTGGLATVGAGALAVWPTGSTAGDRWLVVGVLATLAVVAVVGPLAGPATVWAATALGTTAWLAAATLVPVPWVLRVGLLGGAGLALVAASHVVAARAVPWATPTPTPALTATPTPTPAPTATGADRLPRGAGPVALHLGLVGHAVTALALVVSLGLRAAANAQDTAPTAQTALTALVVALALLTLAALVTALADDRDRSPVGDWCAQAGEGARLLPWALVAVGVPVTAALALRATHVLADDSPWWVLVPAVTAVVEAALVRWWGGARLRVVAVRVSSVAGLGAVLTAALTGGSPSAPVPGHAGAGVWPAFVAWASVLAVGVLQPQARRTWLARWSAWVAPAPLVGLAVRAAVPADRVPDLTLAASVAVGVGGTLALAAAARGGRGVLRTGAPTLAPFVVGAAELVAGTVLAAVAVPAPAGPVLVLVVAAVLVALGALLRFGALGGVAALLGWSAVLWLWTPDLQDRPWVAVATTAGLLLVAETLHRVTTGRGTWTRWDVPVLLAAAPVAVSALVLGLADEPVLVLVGTGSCAAAVAVALRLRGRPVVAELSGALAALLVITGAAVAGVGWFALALLAVGAAHTTLAARATGVARGVRQAVGVVLAWSAWVAGLVWLDLSGSAARDVTALLGAAVPLGFAAHARLRPEHPARSSAFAWGGSGVAVVGLLTLTAVPGGEGAAGAGSTAALVLAAVLVAVAAALGATPVRLGGLRELSGVAALVAVLLLLGLAHASPVTTVAVLAGLAAALAAAAAVLAARVPGLRAWSRATAVTGAVASTFGLVAAVGADDVLLLGPVLAAAAVQTATAGVTLRLWRLQALAPVLACAAWWSIVAGASDAGAAAYTIPVGLALLVVVELWRADLRRRAEPVARGDVVALELVGVAFLVVVPVVQAVTRSVLEAATVLLVGVLVAGWGALTRVRRRVATGVLVVLVAVVLLVGVPLVALLPGWGGAAVWLLVAGAGLLAVLAATQLERGRTAMRSTWQRLGQDSTGWE